MDSESFFAVEKGLQAALQGRERIVLRRLFRWFSFLLQNGLGWPWDIFQNFPDGGLHWSCIDWAAVSLQNPVGDQLEGERVRRAVFQKEISRHVVMSSLPFLPEADGVVSVGALQVRRADDAELMFDWF